MILSRILYILEQNKKDTTHLYDTDNKVLKQQVKRNIERFPEDFRSQLQELDKKINSVFKFLLKKIDSLHQNEISYKPRWRFNYPGICNQRDALVLIQR